MEFDKITEVSLLYDFYGQLLTKKQQDVMELYYSENYTLAEIGQEFSISRQGAHDALKTGEKALREYETKLGLVKDSQASRKAIKKIDGAIDRLMIDNRENKALNKQLTEIKSTIDGLEE
ncbi:MAG: YlxM family DNA-binding protein [Anaerovoracaceae bacterium]